MTSRTFLRQTLHLIDLREPQAVQTVLERATDAVFAPLGDPAAAAVRCARFSLGRVTYRLGLHFVDAQVRRQCYRLVIEAATGDDTADLNEERRRAEAWIGLWTHGLPWQPLPAAGAGSPQRHQALVAAWRTAELAWQDVGATQRSILEALRRGAWFSTAHKEGGTTIRQVGDGWVAADYGESQQARRFTDAATFLAFLQRFYDHETSRHVWPDRVPEADAWRLIHHRLEPLRHAAGRGTPASAPRRLAAVLAGCLLAGGLGALQWQPGGLTRSQAQAEPRVLDRVPAMPPVRDGSGLQDDQRRRPEALKALKATLPHGRLR